MVTQEKLAWMAAVIDLKGMVIYKRNKMRATPQIVLIVESKNLKVVEQLCEMTGSQVEPKTHRPRKDWMRRACIEHCPEAHVHLEDVTVLPPTSRWTVTGIAAAVVLHNIGPYMVSDDREFSQALADATENTVLHGPGSGAVKATVKRMVQLGWAVPGDIVQKLVWPDDAQKEIAAAS